MTSTTSDSGNDSMMSDNDSLFEELKSVAVDQEPPQQIEQDAANLAFMARILTGRTEFEDQQKLQMILTPSDKDTCSDATGSMFGDLLNALLGGEYSATSDQILGDILIPIRYASICGGQRTAHKSFGSFFTHLFSRRRSDQSSTGYNKGHAEFAVQLLSFYYSCLSFNVPDVTISVLQNFSRNIQYGMDNAVNTLPDLLRRAVKACMTIPSDKINVETITKYFGGSVPFLLIFNPNALTIAMNIAKQNGASTISGTGTGSSSIVVYGEDEEQGGYSSIPQGTRPIILSEGTIADEAELYRKVSGRVRPSPSSVSSSDDSAGGDS